MPSLEHSNIASVAICLKLGSKLSTYCCAVRPFLKYSVDNLSSIVVPHHFIYKNTANEYNRGLALELSGAAELCNKYNHIFPKVQMNVLKLNGAC